MKYDIVALRTANIALEEHLLVADPVGAKPLIQILHNNVDALGQLIPMPPTFKKVSIGRSIRICRKCSELLIGEDHGFCYKCGQAWNIGNLFEGENK